VTCLGRSASALKYSAFFRYQRCGKFCGPAIAQTAVRPLATCDKPSEPASLITPRAYGVAASAWSFRTAIPQNAQAV
jgi:hypothetical protein